MENDNLQKMMDKNGGKKVIPTILIDDNLLTGYDRAALKEILHLK